MKKGSSIWTKSAKIAEFGLDFTTGYWPALVAIVPATITGGYLFLHEHGYLETGLILLWTFVGILLAIGGVLWLGDRKRSRLIRVENDVSFGLAYNSIEVGYEPSSDDSMLQFSILFQNVSGGAIEYKVSRFDVTVGNRTLPDVEFPFVSWIVPRGTFRSYRYPPFPKSEIEGYVGQKIQAVLEFWFDYGQAGRVPSRRLHMKIRTTLKIEADRVAHIDMILKECDTAKQGENDVEFA